jgi:hypothetical protein
MVARLSLRPTLLAALAIAFTGTVPAAAAQDFRWTGGAPLGDGNWSIGANWSGGAAPSGSVGTLKFPKLGGGCGVTQSSKTCYSSDNDLHGLTANAISVENTQGYSLFGNAFTLGAGGLTAAPATSHCPCVPSALFLPIVLGADQTWTIDGEFGLTVGGKVTGQPHALRIVVGSGSSAYLNDVEVGKITATVAGNDRFAFPFLVLDGNRSKTRELNGVDGNPVHVAGGLFLRASHAAIGSLSTNHAVVSGVGSSPPGTLTVNGSVALDPGSEILVYVSHSGAAAGKSYWQLAASGPVDLAGGRLVLSVSTSKGFGPDQPCPKLKRGTIETLIKTKAALKGRFAGIHDKSKATITCTGKQPKVRIHYKKHAVTAKVL